MSTEAGALTVLDINYTIIDNNISLTVKNLLKLNIVGLEEFEE